MDNLFIVNSIKGSTQKQLKKNCQATEEKVYFPGCFNFKNGGVKWWNTVMGRVILIISWYNSKFYIYLT